MLSRIEVAIGQIDVLTLRPRSNLQKIFDIMEEIKNTHKRTHLVVFPEAVNLGYLEQFDRKLLKNSEDLSGLFVSSIRNKAKELSLHVLLGMSRINDESRKALFNSALLIDNEGNLVGIYDKIHLFQQEKEIYQPGFDIKVYDTQIGKIGMAICYDMSFPEISRILALKGAEIVCYIFNGRGDKPHKSTRIEHLARTRAYENNYFVIVANRVGIANRTLFLGHSIITAPDGEIISRSLSNKEEIIYGTLKQQRLMEERNENFLLQERRPDIYQNMIDY